MDEVGNCRTGVQMPHAYQRGWQWIEHIKERGLEIERLIYPASCHPVPICWLTDRLHFVALWRRPPPSGSTIKGRL